MTLNSMPPPPRSRLRLRAAGDTPLAQLSWQPKRADAVWTRSEWTALCYHLHNGNGPSRFIMGWYGFNKKTESWGKIYAKSKTKPVDRVISWAWSSIAGKPKSRLAFVPYSTNERQESRWGGLDFDAHQEGQADRARELAFAAFRVLLNAPDLSIVLETSGTGGWHVWAISKDFHPIQEWVRLLKDVAATIGAPVVSGVCEIYPPDSEPSRFGKGMRAPGCWNPGSDTHSEIVWENTRSFLEIVLSGNSKTRSLITNDLQHELPDREKSFLSPPPLPPSRVAEILRKLGITAASTRNNQLASLVGEVFHQVGQATARSLAEAQYRTATVKPTATESEHMASFGELWAGLASNWTATLSPAERAIVASLETENERDAFRIVRSYARKAKLDGNTDFPIVRDNLAERLGITGPGAKKVRDKLATLGAIRMTCPHVPNKTAARFEWLP